MLTERRLELRAKIIMLEQYIMQYQAMLECLYEDLRIAQGPDLAVWIKAFKED